MSWHCGSFLFLPPTSPKLPRRLRHKKIVAVAVPSSKPPLVPLYPSPPLPTASATHQPKHVSRRSPVQRTRSGGILCRSFSRSPHRAPRSAGFPAAYNHLSSPKTRAPPLFQALTSQLPHKARVLYKSMEARYRSTTPLPGFITDPALLFTPENVCVNPADLHTPNLPPSPILVNDYTHIGNDDPFFNDNSLGPGDEDEHDAFFPNPTLGIGDEENESDELDSTNSATPTCRGFDSPVSFTSASPMSAPHYRMTAPLLVPSPMIPGVAEYSSGSEEEDEGVAPKRPPRTASAPPESTPLREQIGGDGGRRRDRSLPPPATPTPSPALALAPTVKKSRQGKASVIPAVPLVPAPTAAAKLAKPANSAATPTFPAPLAPAPTAAAKPAKPANSAATPTLPAPVAPAPTAAAKPAKPANSAATPTIPAPPPAAAPSADPAAASSKPAESSASAPRPTVPAAATAKRRVSRWDVRAPIDEDLLDCTRGFVPIPLPPPPPGFVAPPGTCPPSPLTLRTIDEGDETEGDIQELAEPSAAPMEEEQRMLLRACMRDMNAVAEHYAPLLGTDVDHLARSYSSTPTFERAPTLWNIYQSYAASPQYGDRELRRMRDVCPDFFANNPTQKPNNAVVNKAYAAFKVAMNGKADEILKNWHELSQLEEPMTFGQRLRTFTNLTDRFQSEFERMSARHDFQAIAVVVGSHLHEDAKLAKILSTGGLDNIIPQMHTVHTTSELLALAKSQAYLFVNGLKLTADDESPAGTPAPPRKNTRAGSAAAAASAASAPAAATAAAAVGAASTSLRTVLVSQRAARKAALTKTSALSNDTKERERLRSASRQEETKAETHLLQEALSSASLADVGRDIFRGSAGLHGTFSWKTLPKELGSADVRILGFPASIRLPGTDSSGKGLTCLNMSERLEMADALDARAIAGEGIQFEAFQQDEQGSVKVTPVTPSDAPLPPRLTPPLVLGASILSRHASSAAPSAAPKILVKHSDWYRFQNKPSQRLEY
ncbi:hypothetical protein B0H19DRAFT_1268496 [Mycena capillaripes]|nr:hypothetical protein B0H19DRAFT_1268496 [Mycena capillaripes]